MKRKPMPPRNHVVVALMKRNAGNGVHGKTFKAQRRLDKVTMLWGCSLEVRHRTFNPAT